MNTRPGTPLIDDTYKYYAFISYKRADSKWADYLYKNLHSYRLPSKLCKKHASLPPKLAPVFMDKQELLPGMLDDNLRQAIAECKYFIAVCSKNCQSNPEYIDMELRYFLETHNNDCTKVIPFIVDQSEHPEVECFSPAMQQLAAEYNLIGVNIFEKGKRRAFLKTVAYMHGILPSEIETFDDARRRKNTVTAVVSSLVLLLCCCSAAYFGTEYWKAHYVKREVSQTEYYQGYAWDGNVVKGVGRIKSSELSSYARYYRFETLSGRVQSVQYMNYAGEVIPLDEETTVLNNGASKILYHYVGQNKDILHTASYYSYDGLPIICYEYSADGTHVTLLQNSESGISGYSSDGIDTGDLFAVKNQITRYRQEYDEKGNLVKRFYAYGEQYHSMPSDNGVYGYTLSYDDAGNLTEVSYFKTPDGSTSAIKETAEEVAASVRYAYDPNTSRMVEVSYWDLDGQLIVQPNGFTSKKISWTAQNGRASVSYYKDDALCLHTEAGYAVQTNHYDGLIATRKSFTDPDGKPIITSAGYASVAYMIDEKGRVTSERYFDVDGNPTIDNSNGVYGYEVVALSENRYCCTYIDQNGNPMMTKDGYAYVYTVQDRFGYNLEREFRDASNELLTDRPAFCVIVYDDIYHKALRMDYLDHNRAPMIGEGGYATILYEYDDRGFTTSMQTLDEKGDLIDLSYGYAKIVSSLKTEGTSTVETHLFYGADGQPVIHHAHGSVGFRYVRGEHGKILSFSYLDENQALCFNPTAGYAKVEYTYDAYANTTSARYFKNEDQLVLFNNQYAKITIERDAQGTKLSETTYDTHGNVLSKEFYDPNDMPTINETLGCARVDYEYDQNDRLSIVWYYNYSTEQGVYLLTFNTVVGYAAAIYEYDDAGALISQSLFDEDTSLMSVIHYDASKTVTLIEQYSRDDAGRTTKIEYFDAAGTPINSEADGCAMIVYHYYDNRNLEETVYYRIVDGEMQIAVNPVMGFAILQEFCNADGSPKMHCFFDPDGNYMNHLYWGYAVCTLKTNESGSYLVYQKLENGTLVSFVPEG